MALEAQRKLEEVTATLSAMQLKMDDLKTIEVPKDRKNSPLYKEATNLASDVKRGLNALNTEIKKIEDPTQQSTYKRQHGDLDAKLKRFNKELKVLITNKPKPEATLQEKENQRIMGGADITGASLVTQDQVMAAMHAAQDDNLRILRDADVIVTTTDALGNEIAMKLAEDTQKLEAINKDMSTLQAEIDRAKKDVMWFARQMAGDKCFLIVMVLVIGALVMLTFWKIWTGRSSGGTAETVPPAPTGVGE